MKVDVDDVEEKDRAELEVDEGSVGATLENVVLTEVLVSLYGGQETAIRSVIVRQSCFLVEVSFPLLLLLHLRRHLLSLRLVSLGLGRPAVRV